MSKRIKWVLATAGGLMLLALAAPYSLGDLGLRGELARSLQARTGLSTSIDGRIVLTLAPAPSLKLDRVSLKDVRSGVDVNAAVLRGRLRLLPLVAGRLEFDSLELSNAEIELDAEALGALAVGGAPNESVPGRIAVTSSRVNIKSAERRDVAIQNVVGAFEWRADSAGATLTASGEWRGERFDLAAFLQSPFALRTGESSATTVTIESRFATLSLNGRIESGLRPQFEGRLALSANAFGNLAQITEIDSRLPFPIARLSATGALKANAQTLSLSDARISIDGNTLEGSLVYSGRDERPLLSATLAADQLSLAPLLTTFPTPLARDRTWSREPIPSSRERPFDLDVRLSVARARYQQIQIQSVGLAIKAQGGQYDISLVDSMIYGGHLKGRISITPAAESVAARANLTFAALDAGSLAGDLFSTKWIGGVLGGQLALESNGSCFEELAQNLDGRLDAAIESGDLIGIDVDQALRRSEKRPLSLPTEVRRGRTSFTKAQISGVIHKGMLDLTEASASGFSLATRVAGGVNVATRSLAVRLTAEQTSVGNVAKTDAAAIAVDLMGQWDDPRFNFDFDGLLRHSDAAAPLLRAWKP